MILQKLLTTFYALIFVTTLFAQEKSPQSQWTVGLDMGFPLHADCNDCHVGNSVSSFLSGNANTQYRIFRWLGITGNLGYFRQQTYSNISLWDNENSSQIPSQRDYSLDFVTWSIGPQLLFRVWQGDLSFETRFGNAYEMANVDATTYDGKNFDIKYKTRSSRFTAVRFGYTYWPKPKFGVMLGVEFTRVANGARLRTPSVPLEEAYPDEDPAVISFLAPRSAGPDLVNIVLGFTYRF